MKDGNNKQVMNASQERYYNSVRTSAQVLASQITPATPHCAYILFTLDASQAGPHAVSVTGATGGRESDLVLLLLEGLFSDDLQPICRKAFDRVDEFIQKKAREKEAQADD